jgi:sterol desaturase/sphingolipid hydroxylase (fatty acid hydroxylase superfamily)
MLSWLWHLSTGWFVISALAVNLLQCAVAAGIGAAVKALPWSTPTVQYGLRPERLQYLLAAGAIMGNSAVLIGGWWLWRHGVIHVSAGLGGRAVAEFAVLTVVMDAAMYAGHYLVHVGRMYPVAHRVHHRFTGISTVTLFAVHPLEVVGFGGIWLAVLTLHAFSAAAIVAYAGVNVLFGTLGHVGIDPLPPRWRDASIFRWIAVPALHVGHHLDPSCNFGFYTTVWDRLLGTLAPGYDAERRVAAVSAPAAQASA